MFDNNKNFLNRELSWLKFNERVLEEANDLDKPLLERLKFIVIASSNLDEFFMIRVAGLKHQFESGINTKDISGITVEEQIRLISQAVHKLVIRKNKYLKNILGGMANNKIYLSSIENLSVDRRRWVEEYFYNSIYPVLTPIAVGVNNQFPLLANRSLNLAVILNRDNNENQTAIIPVPGMLSRLVEVPGENVGQEFVFLEDIIKNHCSGLFRGYNIRDVLAFRITRNADLFIDEEGAEDLLVEVEKSLRQRQRGEAVRLEISKTSRPFLKEFLLDVLKIAEHEVYEIVEQIDDTCFMKLVELIGYEHLRYEPLKPQIPNYLKETDDLFAIIRERNILLHHPYESFMPVVDFIRQAASDVKVLAIKQTLYRVSGNSPIVEALAQAAENGKQVTVAVEVRARFDEENNILWARRLEEAGCHVIYGLVGLKIHGKMALIVRQEDKGIRRYVHMGTGNYNDTTARIYTDMSLFVANEEFGADASAFFNMLSGYSDPPAWNKIVLAPIGLREKLTELIDREIEFAVSGQGGHIIAKMNSLTDKDIILKLYEASSKGVKIQLIVRGICGLKPGIADVSHNITVKSIVGRFLEHHRILYFANGGDEKAYLSSADWMHRNLSARVEILFPVDSSEIVARVKNILEIMLKDNCNSYIMKSDGTYWRADKRDEVVNSQQQLFQEVQDKNYKL